MSEDKPPAVRRVVEIVRRTTMPKKFAKRPLGPVPSAAQVEMLARREKVPTRIAKGELQGQMKCRIWRKLHPEESQSFVQAYAIIDQNPGLSLPDAFGILQSGLTREEFEARKSRTTKKGMVRQARVSVSDQEIHQLLNRWIGEAVPLAVVLSERTFIDQLVSHQPIACQWARSGRVEKLITVLISPQRTWKALSSTIERDPKLAQKPAAVSRHPEKRPFSDPRPFLEAIGQHVRVLLRNGIQLSLPLYRVGAFDLVLGVSDAEVLIPIHALIDWNVGVPA